MSYNKIKFLFMFLALVFMSIQIGAEGELNNKGKSLSKTNGSPSRTRLNINNISTWIYNDGNSDIDPNGNSGLIFPKGSNKAAIFESGFVWGADVNGEKRVGGSTYSQGLIPGAVINGVREDETADHVRIYRVRTDWATGSLNAEINDGEGTAEAIRAQYQKDWTEWPAQYGAPYEDVDGNGQYNADVDIPGFPGADQTVWYVANDFDTATTRSLYGSDPMGIEMQGTFWAYNSSSALGNTFFRKYTIINKGADTFEDMYVSMWSDPDVGDAGDDYSGCDVEKSLMFTFNGDADDGVYGRTPPAAGFDFFQGPIVPGEPTDEAIFNNAVRKGYKNLPMSVHYFFINSDPVYNDPDLGNYVNGTLQFHNLFRGRITTTGTEFTDPNTGEVTPFTLSGDPITGQGWVDGQIHPPGDRRQGMVAGPFTMAPGDTQEVVVAELVAGAFGTVDRLGALQLLKFYDQEAQSTYDNFFQVPKSPLTPTVRVSEMDNEVVLVWDVNEASKTEIETYNDLGYQFQGYVIYQFPSENAQLEDAVIVATYDINDGIGKVIGPQFDVAGGVVLDKVLKFGSDSGVKRQISLKQDLFNGGTPLNNGTPYYFAVTSYCVNEDLAVVPNFLESPITKLEVIPQNIKPGEVIEGTTEEGLELTHNGTANSSVTVKVVDPMAVTGDNYEIFFDQQHYYMDVDGVWKKTNYPDSVGSSLGKPGDVSPSTITGIAVTSPIVGTRDLNLTLDLVAPDFNYAEGIELTFPSNVVINSIDGHGADVLQTGNTILFGKKVESASDLSGAGFFAGGELLSLNINTVDLPLNIDYVIYDDGWATLFCADTANAADCEAYGITDAIVVNAQGVCSITETAYAFKTEQHWNVKNTTKNTVVLEDQRIFGGVNVYTDENVGENANNIFDGLRATVDGSFESPINYLSIRLTSPTGLSTLSRTAAASTSAIALVNYTVFGGTISSWAYDNFGGIGTTDLDVLQQDYEIRWTGVYDEGTDVNGQMVYKVVSGGQMATCFRMVDAASLATSPLNPNPGVAEPFLIRIPFEVWNVDDPAHPYQVNLTFRDRQRSGTETPFYAWNPSNRMYAIVVNSPYNAEQVIQVDGGPDEFNALATWVWVFYGSNYHAGDIVKVNYANPIQLGKDTYTFTAPDFGYDATKAAQDVKKVNVFPNPYYGVNPNEINKYQRYVTFNHLPAKATIRLFNMGGQLVSTIEKDDASQFARWNLSNENGLPVASGVYIAYIDMPDLGKTKILKVAIIQETQILDRF
ncbi:MAG: T9SS type A sorting domain-containing protein [Melioribacteraceae bacterium]